MAENAEPDLSTLSVEQRVDVLIVDAKKRYGIALRKNQAARTPQQAQEFHVCHMYLYNKFKNLLPKHPEPGGRTISWEHLSDANFSDWRPADSLQFLVTKNGTAAQRETAPSGFKWRVGQEPDKEKSTKAMTDYLKRHHVSSMAAPGKQGCAEPCSCGGHASKHITREACDVGGLADLASILAKDQTGPGDPLDEYLKEFKLCRPMAHYTDSRKEEWHVEALTTPHVPVRKHHPQRYFHKKVQGVQHEDDVQEKHGPPLGRRHPIHQPV